MAMGFGGERRLDAISRDLAEEDFGDGEDEKPPSEDHEMHVAGKVCTYCGKVISASQPARLVGEGDWVHEDCHRPRD